MAEVLDGKIRIHLVRSTIGVLPKQRATIRSLGLRKIGSVVEQEVNDAIMGMVKKVSHLVKVENIG
ncbi:MAG: 50S ribosomal protein L30 [Spirochaetaceae bacterium]|jgi:large subunit ribosomal protein L30|nr:50S ribosomal protein L30 [Spirochaetaceae bacterium]